MGVPSFFRWLARRYPKVIIDVNEEVPIEVNGISMPVDASKPNPNGFEIDNLYLDMNGIIHPCTHPLDGSQPDSEDEMFQRIFLYIDRIFNMVRPRKLLYMAIDGVAPRAKMNQQRSRRFRAAQEIKQKEELEDKLRAEWESEGRTPPPKRRRPWDSNVITPGTPFMYRLSQALHYYVAERLSTMPGWKKVKVIFSDARVPGEGEHKIMRFIRQQRAQEGYNPNTSHCLYGMDADLIMLALASHDPKFYIIREQVTITNGPTKNCDMCGSKDHYTDQCTGETKEKTKGEEPEDIVEAVQPFQYLDISVLREYLAYELNVDQLPFPFDLENALDDFVFMCLFVGNDFLPHLPSLEIREGAIERMINIYRRLLPSLGGFISENGKLNMTRVDILLAELGSMEDSILRNRKRNEEYMNKKRESRIEKVKTLKRQREEAATQRLEAAEKLGVKQLGGSIHDEYLQPAANQSLLLTAPLASESAVVASDSVKSEDPLESAAIEIAMKIESIANTNGHKLENNEETEKSSPEPATAAATADSSSSPSKRQKVESISESAVKSEPVVVAESAQSLVDQIISLGDEDESPSAPVTIIKNNNEFSADSLPGALASPTAVQVQTADFPTILSARVKKLGEPMNNEDSVRLGDEGWKSRYYGEKLHIKLENGEETDVKEADRLFQTYSEGLNWVMSYYYDGCISWDWYFPFHYAPMASDLRNLDRFPLNFNLSAPFSPIGQLMGVLPSASAHCMPVECRELMESPFSPLKDFYPEEFPLDLNGKKFLWQAVALLPWIDEKRLLESLKQIESTFTPDEKERNSLGSDYLFIHRTHPLANSIAPLYEKYSISDLMNLTEEESNKLLFPLDMNESAGMSGFVQPYYNALLPGANVESKCGLETAKDVACISVIYHLPPPKPHSCSLLPGLTMNPPQLDDHDIRFLSKNRGGGGIGGGNQPKFGEREQFIQNSNETFKPTIRILGQTVGPDGMKIQQQPHPQSINNINQPAGQYYAHHGPAGFSNPPHMNGPGFQPQPMMNNQFRIGPDGRPVPIQSMDQNQQFNPYQPQQQHYPQQQQFAGQQQSQPGFGQFFHPQFPQQQPHMQQQYAGQQPMNQPFQPHLQPFQQQNQTQMPPQSAPAAAWTPQQHRR